MFNVPKPVRSSRAPGSPHAAPNAPWITHRAAGVLAALGIAAAGLAMTPPAQRALPGWLDTFCTLATRANDALTAKVTSATGRATPTAMANASTGNGGAARPATKVTPLSCEPLANAPGKSVTTAMVEFPPLAFSPAHRHPGAVTAVVIEGTIRSQLNAEAPVTYRANQTWFEPPGTLHTMTENPDPVHPARLLAFFVTEENCGPLTIYEPVTQPS
ncbi:cupin domain-containing protein [Pandoraea iniqua]|uniref:cupin domain-containing protein n=1 Tax=Pandoraea iniqua TaxID=2508288 RepID=UPI00125967DF|nr:cupin domain-containing protein [Pandoraea iniqua]VVE58760.1 cupin domain-containing protein [Pandoraea iniqua]